MNIFSYSSIDGFNFDQIYKDAERYKPKEIHFLTELEWDFNCPKNFVKSLKDLGIGVRVVLGSFYSEFYNDYLVEKNLEKSDVIFWGTYWFNWAAECLIHEIDFLNYQNSIFTIPFICLNNRSHIHRCFILDELAKHNLLDKGVVTFHDFLHENKDFNFRYFNRQQLKLSDNFDKNLDSFNIPIEFHNSFLHVVTEANHNSCFLTEKLIKPLLLKKPFLILGCPFYHKKLSELGFKLYDEIFDYDFDSEINLSIRTEKLVKNINSVINTDLMKLYNKVQEKINYNFNHAISIINDKNLIPFFIVKRIFQNDIQKTPNDTRNLTLIKRTFK